MLPFLAGLPNSFTPFFKARAVRKPSALFLHPVPSRPGTPRASIKPPLCALLWAVLASAPGAGTVQMESYFTNCTFLRNSAAQSGGALVYRGLGVLELNFCTFDTNSAGTQDGGALWVYPVRTSPLSLA